MGIFNRNDDYQEKYQLEAKVDMLKEYLIFIKTNPNSMSAVYGKVENVRIWLQSLKNQYGANMPKGMERQIKKGELILGDIDKEIKVQMEKLGKSNDKRVRQLEQKTKNFDKAVNGESGMQVTDEEVEAKLREIMESGSYSNGGRTR